MDPGPAQDLVDAMDDDRPLAIRRGRRTTAGPSNPQNPGSGGKSAVRSRGMKTPPATPQKPKKRVRISDPEPDPDSDADLDRENFSSSTGLTPFIKRARVSSPAQPFSPTRRGRRSLAADYSPISGDMQFFPLRQVLDSRSRRRIRRNRLSEEINNIESEKRNEFRAWKVEKEKMIEEIRDKNQEIQILRKRQEITNQTSQEVGIQTAYNQIEMSGLRAEFQGPFQDKAGSPGSEQDAFSDANSIIDVHEEFHSSIPDIFFGTPARRAFLSPPESSENTPSKAAGNDDPELIKLKSQLETLKNQISNLDTALDLANTSKDRLVAKLSPYMLEKNTSANDDTIDAALDHVITQLAVAQSAAEESQRFWTLSEKLSDFFPTGAKPDAIVEILQQQFRQARLDLEHLSPGENTEGFENHELLSMLIARLQALTDKVAQQESSIDEYHEQEISLRKQLGSQVDAVTYYRRSLEVAQSSVDMLEEELEDRESSISKLNNALQDYRNEVSKLEALISRVEVEHTGDLAAVRYEYETAQRVLKEKLTNTNLERDKLAAMEEGREMLVQELQRRLEAVQSAARDMGTQVETLVRDKEVLTDKIAGMEASAADRQRELGETLAQHDAQVAQLETEIARLNAQVEGETRRVGLIVKDIEVLGETMIKEARKYMATTTTPANDDDAAANGGGSGNNTLPPRDSSDAL